MNVMTVNGYTAKIEHERLALKAQAKGKSINALAQEALTQWVGAH